MKTQLLSDALQRAGKPPWTAGASIRAFPPRRQSNGFTLIELLVVTGILSLFIAVMLPALSEARRSARAVVCVSNLRTLGIGAHIYGTVFKDVLPWEGYAEGDRPARHLGPWEEPSQWFNACPTYAGYPPYHEMQQMDLAGKTRLPRNGNQSFFVCSEANPAAPGPKDDLVTDGYLMLWGTNLAGTRLDRRKTYWSYGYNTELDAGEEDRHSSRRVAMHDIRRPSVVVFLVEKLMRPDEHDPAFASGVGQAAVSWKEFTTRHRGGGFLLFLDNHVQYFTRKDLLAAPHAPEDYNQPARVVWNPRGIAN